MSAFKMIIVRFPLLFGVLFLLGYVIAKALNYRHSDDVLLGSIVLIGLSVMLNILM